MSSSPMEPSHPIRHRVGIVLVCLVALLTARDGWNLRVQRPNATRAPVVDEPAAKERAPEQPTFEIADDPESFRQAVLRPICTLDGATDLPCCDLTFDPTAELKAEFVFALTPETFPLMSQFVPGMPGRDATIGLEIPAKVAEIEPVQPDSYLLWFPPVGKCRNLKKDSQGKEYCAPEAPVEVPEPASVALMLGGGAALVLSTRRK